MVGCAALAALVGATAQPRPDLLPLLVLADLWLLAYPHVISTFTKLAGTADDRARNALLLWLLPAVFAATLVLGLAAGVAAIATLYFFWQWYHYVRQSWGIAQRLRGPAAQALPTDRRWSQVVLWSIPVWGLLNRCHQHPDTFLWLPVWLPHVPGWGVQAAGMLAAALVSWWMVLQAWAWKSGKLVHGHVLYMATHFAVFAAGYVLIDDVTTGWLLVNVWHNAQYLQFVWSHNRQRFAGAPAPDGTVLAWFSQPGLARASLYFGACLLTSAVLYSVALGGASWATHTLLEGLGLQAISAVLLITMSINFHHYIVDSVIWRRKRKAQP